MSNPIQLSAKLTADFELLANGGFAPLTGFQGKADWESILDNMHLANGAPWPIPVTLGSETGEVGETVELIGSHGEALGTLTIEEVFERDLKLEAERVYRTTDEAHPGVAALYSEAARTIAGPIEVKQLPDHIDAVAPYLLTPAESKAEFASRGWKTVVGFQTRNPIHRAHEYITKVALEGVDGLFLHPLVGETKSDDIDADVRMRCYEVLIDGYYPKERVVLGVNRQQCVTPDRVRLFFTLWFVATMAARTSSSAVTTPVLVTTTAPTTHRQSSTSSSLASWALSH